MSLSLAQFREGLEPFLEQDSFIRPFACDGSPLDCRVFLVGFNAAKRLERPFLNYWSDDYGFLKSRFMDDYLRERNLTRPRGTRAHIEKFVLGLGSKACLETNIHSKPTATKRELARQQQETGVFEFLFETIKPEIVVPYSKDPIAFFERETGRSDFVGELQWVEWKGHRFRLYGVRQHFRSFGFENAESLGSRLANCLT